MNETPVRESHTIGAAGLDVRPGRRHPEPRPRLTDALPPIRPKKAKRPWRWFAFASIVAALAAVFLLRPEWQGREVAAAPALHLQVGLEPEGEGLLLQWERSAVPAGARTYLDIQDGGRGEQVLLDPAVARLGAVTYRPISGNLRFRMTLKDSKKDRVLAQDAASVVYTQPILARNFRESPEP